jgi:hypothetical protein
MVLKISADVLLLTEGQKSHSEGTVLNMTIRCRSGTKANGRQELDRELSDVLIAISVVSRRIADRFSAVSTTEKMKRKGDNPNGKRTRIIHVH